MPTNNPVTAPWTGTIDKAAQRAALLANLPLPLLTAAEILDLNTGPTCKMVLFDGRCFTRDFADTTSLHDGVTILRSLDGYIFKALPIWPGQAVEASLTTPPAVTNADIGKAWIVNAAPTGAWAANAQAIAIWTAIGWRFVTPSIGFVVLNKATGRRRQVNASGLWEDGLGVLPQSAASLPPSSLLWPMGITVVDTRNTPPAIANAYIVGAAPTGAWVGQSGKVAVAFAGNWQFLTGYEGATLWDQSINAQRVNLSGVWVSQTGVALVAKRVLITPSSFTSSLTAPAGTPTTATGVQIGLFNHAVKKVGNVLRFNIPNEPTTPNTAFVKSLHVDGGVSATSWSTNAPLLSATPADILNHTYALRLHGDGTTGPVLPLCRIELEEIAP
jgi:hypothetical protein